MSSTREKSAVEEDKASITEKTVKASLSQHIPTNSFSPLQREASALVPEKEEADSIKQDIIEIISPQRMWCLGKQKQHIVMCQDPNSIKFIEKLPPSIALCLAFPSIKEWRFECDRYKSMMTFYSEYQDLDEIALLRSIQYTIEITTEDRDVIAVCYIPSLKVLSLIDALGCRAIIAEPDRDKCLELVKNTENWSKPKS